MDDKDGGGFGAAPPVGSLGNYKGVMLCNRPTDEPSRIGGPGDFNVKPFKSTISATCREPIGLPPCKEAEKEKPATEVKNRGPSAALRRHVRWIKELQDQVREDQKRVEEDDGKHAKRKEGMSDVFKKQRDAIREMRKEKDELSRDELEAVMHQFPPTGTKVKNKGAKKPLWAMTEDEKEAFDEQEAADLISFAEGLDYDKFVSDLEFRKQLQVVKDRAHKLQREQDAFKDSILKEFNDDQGEDYEGSDAGGSRLSGVDGASLFGEDELEAGAADRRRRRRREDGQDPDRVDWDASTTCSESRQADREVKSFADQVFENNPQMKGVHSKDSMQKLIEKARSDGMPATPSTNY